MGVKSGGRLERGEFVHAQDCERRPGGFQSLRVRRQFRVGDEHIGAGIVQNVIYLGGFQEIVDRHDHAAGRQDPEHRRHKLRAIFHP